MHHISFDNFLHAQTEPACSMAPQLYMAKLYAAT